MDRSRQYLRRLRKYIDQRKMNEGINTVPRWMSDGMLLSSMSATFNTYSTCKVTLSEMPGLEDLSELSEAISSVYSQNINLETFIREEWIHSLNGNMHSKKFTLRSDCDFVKDCQAYLERWNRPSEYLDNYIKRLEGFICLPALVLQNPPENEELPFDMLVAISPTFQWLNSTLSPLGLSIKNVCMINLFPFITENWLRSLGPADQEKALQESLDLTIELFKTYQLETVISCQCLTQKPPEWLGPLVYHPLVQSLSSNVLNAKNRAIKIVQLYGRTINVIQGFHPSYILRAPRETYRNDRHRILSSLLTDTYAPCQLWMKQEIIASMGNMLPQLQESASNLRNLIWSFQALEQKLYTVSSNTDYYVYSGDRGNGGDEPPFSIQIWLKVLSYFLFCLPSQALALGLKDNRNPRPSDLFPPGGE